MKLEDIRSQAVSTAFTTCASLSSENRISG